MLPNDGELVVKIVPLKRRHLRRVLEIEAVSYSRQWSRSVFLSELALRSSRAYAAALVDDVVVGYGGVMMVGDLGHITTLAVDPARRRTKVGTRLLVQLTAEMLRRGARTARLEVAVSNEAARALYTRFGYMPVGIRRNYYPETHEDAIVMTVGEIDGEDYQARVRKEVAGIPGRTQAIMASPW